MTLEISPTPRSSDPELPTAPYVEEVEPNAFVYVNKNGLWNSGFVIGGECVAVVDAMLTPACAHGVLEEVRARTDLPVRYLVITHQHSDHVLGAKVFCPPAEMVAHAEVMA